MTTMRMTTLLVVGLALLTVVLVFAQIEVLALVVSLVALGVSVWVWRSREVISTAREHAEWARDREEEEEWSVLGIPASDEIEESKDFITMEVRMDPEEYDPDDLTKGGEFGPPMRDGEPLPPPPGVGG
jgi:hypothetical protein